MAYVTVDPATGKQSRFFLEIRDAELFDALKAADTCYRSDWSLRSTDERARIIDGTSAHMRANIAEYAALATTEMEKPVVQSHWEVGLSADILDYYARNAASFMKPHRVVSSFIPLHPQTQRVQ